MQGQRIHYSVAFKEHNYKPEATFAERAIKWESIVHTGNRKDMSWAERWTDLLEMGVFDLPLVAQIVGELRDGISSDSDLIHIMDRLSFIAFSGW